MKTSVFIIALICITSLRLNGQVDWPSKQFQDIFQDSKITKPIIKYPKNNHDLYSDKIIKPIWDQSLKHNHIELPEIKYSYDKLLAERFPGSEIFYAKRPNLISIQKSFVKKPDTTAKYYLIIKDPILSRRIN